MEHDCPEQIQKLLEVCANFAKAVQLQGLDLSANSLAQVDWCLERFRERLATCGPEEAKENLNYVVLAWGAYVGEVVRRSIPGWEWEFPAGEMHRLKRKGPHGVGHVFWRPCALVLQRMQRPDLHIARLCQEELERALWAFEHANELSEEPKGES